MIMLIKYKDPYWEHGKLGDCDFGYWTQGYQLDHSLFLTQTLKVSFDNGHGGLPQVLPFLARIRWGVEIFETADLWGNKLGLGLGPWACQ